MVDNEPTKNKKIIIIHYYFLYGGSNYYSKPTLFTYKLNIQFWTKKDRTPPKTNSNNKILIKNNKKYNNKV